jgi:hypothetical protein
MKQYQDYINNLINEYILKSYKYLWRQNKYHDQIN